MNGHKQTFKRWHGELNEPRDIDTNKRWGSSLRMRAAHIEIQSLRTSDACEYDLVILSGRVYQWDGTPGSINGTAEYGRGGFTAGEPFDRMPDWVAELVNTITEGQVTRGDV